MPIELKKLLMKPENKGHKLIENMKRDTFYDTLYVNYKMSDEMVEKLSKSRYEFNIRAPNRFISSLRELNSCWGTGDQEAIKKMQVNYLFNEQIQHKCKIENQEYKPKLIINAEKIKMWYRLDRTYLAPKVNLYMNILTKYLRRDKERLVFLNIYFEYLKNMVDKELNDARDSGNGINVEFNDNGISIHINSYTDILSKILKKIMMLIFDLNYFKVHINAENYSEMLVNTQDRLRDLYSKSPSDKLNQIFTKIVKKGYVPMEDIVYDLNKNKARYSREEFLKVLPSIQSDFYIHSLFYGSVNDLELKEMKRTFKKYLKTKSKGVDKNEYIKKKWALMNELHSHNYLDGSFVYKHMQTKSEDNKMNYISNYYQIGVRSIKTIILSNFVELLWGNLFNYQIRTLKKIGNVISSKRLVIDNITVYLIFYYLVFQFCRSIYKISR
jgi:secreted Zn-dependent insulinase-like peptidase